MNNYDWFWVKTRNKDKTCSNFIFFELINNYNRNNYYFYTINCSNKQSNVNYFILFIFYL